MCRRSAPNHGGRPLSRGGQERFGGDATARRGDPTACGGKRAASWRSGRGGKENQKAGGLPGRAGGGRPGGTRPA
eukprot:2176609-Prorocentrum_lima.AAC.1